MSSQTNHLYARAAATRRRAAFASLASNGAAARALNRRSRLLVRAAYRRLASYRRRAA